MVAQDLTAERSEFADQFLKGRDYANAAHFEIEHAMSEFRVINCLIT